MTPEQAREETRALFDLLDAAALRSTQAIMDAEPRPPTRQELAIERSRVVLEQLLLEHAAMTEALRWRKPAEAIGKLNGSDVVLCRNLRSGFLGGCGVCELRDGDEWLPVPT